MGCMDSKGKEPVTPSTPIVVQGNAGLLETGLANMKKNLIEQHTNKSMGMVAEFIKTLFTFVESTLSTGERMEVPDFIGLAFMGLNMMDGFTIDGVKYPQTIGSALHSLTEPQELIRKNLPDNFLSCAHHFKFIRDNRSRACEHGSWVEEREARGAMGKVYNEGPVAGGDTSTPGYHELQRIMLRVLHPLCDMVDALLNPSVEDRFIRFTGKTHDYLDALKMKLGIVTTIVKGFEALPEANAARDLRLVTVVGPESYGKSTLINCIIHKGANEDFKPTTSGIGRGKQVICKIAEGPLETLQRTMDEFPQMGAGWRMVREVNEEMMKKRKEKKKKKEGLALGIREMDMLLATVPFEPPYPVQFLDVPGIKKETIFHARVAVGLATTLVLVSGSAETLKTELENGDLLLLREVVKGLNRPIPIQCVASYRITESQFNDSKDRMKQILQESFPICKKMIKEPLFMNFFQAKDDAHRQVMVKKFYTAMARAEAKTVDPIDSFGTLEHDVESFTKVLSAFLRDEMKDYLTTQVRPPAGAVSKVQRNIVRYLKKIETQSSALEGAFSPDRISEALEGVKVGRVGFYRHHAAGLALLEVREVAHHVQSLLNQCRIHHMKWLIECSKEFHEKSFGEAFGPLKELAKTSSTAFNGRLCATFKFCNQQRKSKEKSLAWWTQEYTSHIAPYLDGPALACLLMGFHLVSTDARNKVDFVGLLFPKGTRDIETLNRIENGVTDNLIKALGEVDYSRWVSKTRSELSGKEPDREAAFQEVCEAISSAGRKFAEIAEATGFLTRTSDNSAMMALVDITFVLMEKVFIDVTEETGGFNYTKFSQHLRRHACTEELRSFTPVIERTEQPEAACVACCEALKWMQTNPSVSAEWTAKFRSRTMEKDIEMIRGLQYMLSTEFSGRADSRPGRPMLLIPQNFRNTIMKRSAMQNKRFRVASAALAVLDQRIELRADSRPSREFPPYALREIQRAGARVAVFMRHVDTTSYDPMHEEIMLLDNLQVNPNPLVTLFVLWTPADPGVEWDTPEFEQRWKSFKSNAFSLDIQLVPMKASFDCQRFVDGQVAKALQEAGEKAAKKSGLARQMEKVMLRNFAAEVARYEADFASAQKTDPKTFHGRMVKDHHKKLDSLMCGIDPRQKSFDIPDPDFNKKNFNTTTTDQLRQYARAEAAACAGADAASTSGTAEGSATDLKEGTTFNELQCRSFHFHVLLGQCVQMCSKLAERVYDNVVTKILDEIGDKEFFMDSGQILKELDAFCLKFREHPEFDEEIKQLGLLKLLITKQSFQHMYVGCVSSRLMPALYATVLPPLLKGGGGGEVPTEEWYEAHMKLAKAMLKDGNSRSQPQRRTST